MAIFKRKYPDGKESKDYYMSYYVNGRKIFQSTKCSNYKVAQQILEDIRTKIAKGEFLQIERAEKIKFNVFVDEYDKLYVESERETERSKQRERSLIKHLKRYFGNKYINNITSKTIDEYKIFRLNVGVKKSTVNREISVLSSIFSKAMERGHIKNDVSKRKLFKLHGQDKREVFLNEEQINKFLEASSPKLKPILICALNTGMRKGEILSLKWGNIYRENINPESNFYGIIHLEASNTKSKKSRNIPITKPLHEALQLIPSRSRYVFYNKKGEQLKDIQSPFRTLLKKTDIKCRFHDLRHTFASIYAKIPGSNIYYLKDILGHSSIRMTERYAHLFHDVNYIQMVKFGDYMSLITNKEKVQMNSSNIVALAKIGNVSNN